TKKKEKTEYHMADPGYGMITLEPEIVSKEWLGNDEKGIVIVLEKDNEEPIIQQKEKTRQRKKEKIDLSFLKPVFDFIRENKFKYLLGCIFLLLSLAASWMMPILFRKIVDTGIVGRSYQIVWILLLA